MFDLTESRTSDAVLFDAARTADVINRLDDVASKQPVTVKGSMGQEVIQPCIAQAQTARGQLRPTAGPTQLRRTPRTSPMPPMPAHDDATDPQRQHPMLGPPVCRRTPDVRYVALPRRVTGLPGGARRSYPTTSDPVMNAAGLSAAEWFRHMLLTPPRLSNSPLPNPGVEHT